MHARSSSREARREVIDKLIHTIRFQPHSSDCSVHGRVLPRGPMDDSEDLRGPPKPCDCWRAAFFREADLLQAQVEQLKNTIAILEADCEDGTCRACVKCYDNLEFELQKVKANLAAEQVDHKYMQTLLREQRDEAVSAAAVQSRACAEEMLKREAMQINWDTMVASVKHHYEAQMNAEARERIMRQAFLLKTLIRK